MYVYHNLLVPSKYEKKRKNCKTHDQYNRIIIVANRNNDLATYLFFYYATLLIYSRSFGRIRPVVPLLIPHQITQTYPADEGVEKKHGGRTRLHPCEENDVGKITESGKNRNNVAPRYAG